MLGEEAKGWNGKHERSEGLHKRSAEDCGKPLAPRQGSALSEVWFPYSCASAHMILGSRCGQEQAAVVGGGRREAAGDREENTSPLGLFCKDNPKFSEE